MEMIYFLERHMSIYAEKNSLFILCPIEGIGEVYNVDQLLYSFMKDVKYPITRGKEKKEKKGYKRIYLNVGNKEFYEEYLTELIGRQVKHINEEAKGLLVKDMNFDSIVDKAWKENVLKDNGDNICGNLDVKVKHLFIDIKSGAQCKVYFLPSDINTKEERIIYNSNIFFNNLLKVVEKKHHVIILNEKLEGGVIYMHNKHARPGDNHYHKKYIIEGIKTLLIDELSGYYDIYETYDITENFEGGYTKCPIKLKKRL